MKKTMAMVLVTVLMLAAFPVCEGENLQILRGPVIGIAWRSDTDSEFSRIFAVRSNQQAENGCC